MSIDPGAAWTPDVPDNALAADPAAVIAAHRAEMERLDHFEPTQLCGAVASAIINTPGGNNMLAMLACTEEPGHYPETGHSVVLVWFDSTEDAVEATQPAAPGCETCADVGIVQGEPCSAEGCQAAQVYRDAQKASRAARSAGQAEVPPQQPAGLPQGTYLEGEDL